YLRAYHGPSKRLRMVHDVVWEEHYGPIPEGVEVHHKDEDKLNNHISNLALVDDVTHKRIHSGCELRDGVWFKPCIKCRIMKSVDDFYRVRTRNNHVSSKCKVCSSRDAVLNKQRRRYEKSTTSVQSLPGVLGK